MSFNLEILSDCGNEPVSEIITICDDALSRIKSTIRVVDVQKLLLVSSALVEEIIESNALEFSGERPPASGDELADCETFKSYVELARREFKAQFDELIIIKAKEDYKKSKVSS